MKSLTTQNARCVLQSLFASKYVNKCCKLVIAFSFPDFKEKTAKQGETLVEELKASQEKSLSEASELHVKELDLLQSQVETLKQELSSSKDKTQELKKQVSELQPYKEQAQVNTRSQTH